MRKALSRFFEYFINGAYKFGKLFFSFTSLYSLNKEAAVKQTQDFKQLRNEKKILEKEFKKTQVMGHSSAACVRVSSPDLLVSSLSAVGPHHAESEAPRMQGQRGAPLGFPRASIQNSCPPIHCLHCFCFVFTGKTR